MKGRERAIDWPGESQPFTHTGGALAMSRYYAGNHLILSEELCRPFILLHLCYTLLTTSTRFFLPTPLPPRLSSSSSSSNCLPFHHSRSLLSHLLSTFLLSLNTVALSHTSPWLWTGPPHSRSLITNPSSIPPPATPSPARPAWLRGEDRDPRVLWDLSACMMLLYVVSLGLSLFHQLLFSAFTFPSADSLRSPSPSRRRRLLLSHLTSILLAADMAGLLLFAYRLHVDAAVELIPYALVEAIRVVHTWQVVARGGRVSHLSDAAQRLRRVDEDENDREDASEAEDEDAEGCGGRSEGPEVEFASLIAEAAEMTGELRQRAVPVAASTAPAQRSR